MYDFPSTEPVDVEVNISVVSGRSAGCFSNGLLLLTGARDACKFPRSACFQVSSRSQWPCMQNDRQRNGLVEHGFGLESRQHFQEFEYLSSNLRKVEGSKPDFAFHQGFR